MDGPRPLAGFSRLNLTALTSAAFVLVLGCAVAAGAQTIDDGSVSSVGSWQAPGVAQSHVLPVDGRTAASPELVRSASVHFVDSKQAPTPVLAGNPAIHVTDVQAEPAPKIAVDPRVKVSDDSKAAPLPAPANTKVEMIVSSVRLGGQTSA
jgi:hypothetical protein